VIANRLLLLGLMLVALAVLGLHFTDDGMAACRTSHSFDVCHDSLY
jgi:hypothetical protein